MQRVPVISASGRPLKWQEWQSSNARGGNWKGEASVTPATFKVIAKPNIYRRQLHFENPDSL